MVQDVMNLIVFQVSNALKIYPNPRSYVKAVILRASRVQNVAIAPLGLEPSGERCMILEILVAQDLATFSWCIPNTVAANVTPIAAPIRKNWPCAIATTPIAWLIWPFVWSWRTDCLTDQPPGTYGETTWCSCLGALSGTGWRRREKKAEQIIEKQYLERVLVNFSGYIAADELYDGPFCVLSIVDNHSFERLTYAVLDHNPTGDDIRRFFKRFKKHLYDRGLTVKGITTDGSPLYPDPITEVFGSGVEHQLCEFHVLQEIAKAVLKAVTQARKTLKSQKVKCGRGRPSGKVARGIARKNDRIQAKIKDLFDQRHLFVKKKLTPKEKKILLRITRGFPVLRKLRSIMDEVYRLFDRRCRTETALGKLAKLRNRVKRFRSLNKALNKLFSPNLEKALTFLDDSLLPATSNAVERSNRRHRKMQKSIYRVRTKAHISQRIATDMLRDISMNQAQQTINTLHTARGWVRRKRA